jgi:signal transduction histidine kinase
MSESSPRLRQWHRRPEFLIGAALVLAVLLVGWGAWTLWTTMMRHRATADETLRDHAAYLADSYAGSVQSRTFLDVRTLLRGAQRALAANGTLTADSLAILTGAEAFSRYVLELAPRRYFVFDSVQAIATSAGDSVDALLTTALQTRLARPRPAEATYVGTVIVRGADTTIAFVERERGGTRWVGLEVPLARFREQILQMPLGPTLMAFNRLRDSLKMPQSDSTKVPIAVRLVGDHGEVLLESGNVELGQWRSERLVLGPLMARVTYAILPPAVPVLMPGGYPPTPGAPVAAAVALALLLLGGTAVIAWRAIALGRLREEFTSSISHELRTPLANIQLFAETLLLERAGSEAARHRALDTIVRETRHLSQMVENVLALSRVGRPAHRLSPRPDDIERLVREASALFEPLARQHHITLDVTVAPGPPATLDGDAVRRILLNLIDNAIRHGGDGGVVTVMSRHDHDRLELTVTDEGPGIAPADRTRIWQAFERGEGSGSGIGLAVVKQLVLLHGGVVTIDEAIPHGARFHVVLPLHTGR